MTGDEATDALIAEFEARTLDKTKWTHAAHVTTALAYVRTLGSDEALARLRTNIRAYNAAAGSPPDAYHETVTRAWVAIIVRFLAESDPARPFATLLAALLERCGRKDYLLKHYSRELLFSNLARAEWVLPDLAKLE
jgi:phage tail sheath gpL-like